MEFYAGTHDDIRREFTMRALKRLFGATKLWSIMPLLVVSFLVTAAQAQLHGYYVALDNRDVITSGGYAGLPNPNFGRLTFLFAHTSESDPSSNHFHGIGAYSYSGPATAPEIIPTNSNNRIPETFSGEPPLPLTLSLVHTPGGLLPWRLRYISKPGESEYSHLHTDSIHSLSGFPSGSPEDFLYRSSEGRWTLPLTGAVIALQLLEISPGLQIANEQGETILSKPGDVYILGDGDSFSFTPTYWAPRTAAPGNYSATFKLHDLRNGGTPFPESGIFNFDFTIP
jgi:hypothetical protein